MGPGVVHAVQVNKPVCVHLGGGRLTEVKRTAVVAVGAIGTDKDPQRASDALQFKPCPHKRIFLSLNAGIL